MEENKEITEAVSTQNTQISKEIEDLYLKARELKKQLPKKHKKKLLPQAISDEEFKKIINAFNNDSRAKEAKIACLIAYESGLRIAEVKNLKKEDINLVAKSIFVRQGKFSKDRVVPLPLTWKNYMIDFIPIKKCIRALQSIFKAAVIRAGVNPKYHFHNLRHSFATHCLERGMPINQLQILMGHSSVGTTNVYIQANPQDALNTYRRIF